MDSPQGCCYSPNDFHIDSNKSLFSVLQSKFVDLYGPLFFLLLSSLEEDAMQDSQQSQEVIFILDKHNMSFPPHVEFKNLSFR